jgi:hypothetical protein
VGKVRVPGFIGSRGSNIYPVALGYGVHAHQRQVEGAVMHLDNVITVAAGDPPLGTRVARGSDVIVILDYRP